MVAVNYEIGVDGEMPGREASPSGGCLPIVSSPYRGLKKKRLLKGKLRKD